MREGRWHGPVSWVLPALVVALIILGFGGQTLRRNRDYRTEYSIWLDTVMKNPASHRSHNNLGIAILQKGQVDEAIVHYQKALQIKPDFAEAHNNLGKALRQAGQVDEATIHYKRALEINPDFAEAHYNLGNALLQKRQVNEATIHYKRALEIKPDYAEAHNNLGMASFQKGQMDEAITHLELAIKINPTALDALNNLAWIMAIGNEPSMRNGGRALELAQMADQLSGGNHPIVLHTLAAAYAECGRFAEATECADRALALAISQGNTVLTNAIRDERALYQARKPMRDIRPVLTDAPFTAP